MAAKDDLGRAGERLAVAYLEAHRFDIVDRNWRCKTGEIDAVAVRGSTVVVVEVKTRRSRDYGDPLEAVDSRKMARLWRLAREWIAEHPDIARHRDVRIDIVGITGDERAGFALEHLEDVR